MESTLVRPIVSRRAFLRRSAASALGGFALLRIGSGAAESPNNKLNLGVVGVANRGGANLRGVSSQNIVALCDVDDHYLAAAAVDHPGAAKYNDFRKMLDRNDLDAVVVSTADHTHAVATAAALRSDRHVYCEKPLTHTVSEARQINRLAQERGRVTQMGTQIHAGDNYRRVVELIRTDAIGPVREVHNWVGSVWSGGDRPSETPPVPDHIHWDLWLGPARERPYHPVYIPARWRGWWDFGGGAMSDMACHHMDLPFWALNLRHPASVEAEGPEPDPETAPAWRIVRYTFPPRGTLPGVHLTWYNGDKRPHYVAEGVIPDWGAGTLFVGEKGMLLADYNRHLLLPEADFQGFTPPEPFIPSSIGHHAEWIEACKGNGSTTCHFDYSGPLTEAVLLGNVAFRTGKKINWDARRLKALGAPEADEFIQHHYRDGWSL